MSFISNALQQLRPVDRLRDATQDAVNDLAPVVTAPLALLQALDPNRQLDARRVFAASVSASASDRSRDFDDEPTHTKPRRGLSTTEPLTPPVVEPVAKLADEATEAATNTLFGQSVRLAGSGLAVAGAVVDDATKESARFKGLGNKLGVAGAVIGLAGFAKDPSLDTGARAAAGATGVVAIFAKGGAKAALGTVGTAATVGFSIVDTIKALREGDEGKAATAALPAVGAGIGAGIGALGFGVGAVPGAAIGAAVGSGLSAAINIGGELFG